MKLQILHNKFIVNIRTIGLLTITCLLTLLLSCNKENQISEVNDGKATIKIVMLGTSNETELIASAKGTQADPMIQLIDVPFGENMIITARLEQVGGASHMTGNGDKVAAVVRNPLLPNIKYTILIYNDQGNLVDERAYTSGSESKVQGVKLIPGNYTFVGYSINSTSLVPQIINKNSLHDAINEMTDADLMFFSRKQNVIAGNNNINVTLKHRFSEITTTISVGNVWKGRIHAMGASYFVSQTGGSVKASDGTLTWTGNTVNKPVGFPTIGANTTTISASTLLLHKGTGGANVNPGTGSGGILRIEGLKINDVTNVLELTDLRINPGFKYNLNLNLNAPCLESSITPFNVANHNSGSPRETTFEFPSADFGFVLDINSLDNSFNMTINNQPLIQTRSREVTRTRSCSSCAWDNWSPATGWNNPGTWTNWTAGELQFEKNGTGTNTNATTNNIQFIGGDKHPPWNSGTQILSPTPPIFYNNWNVATFGPILKVYIHADGKVSYTGRKSANNSTQHAMELVGLESDASNISRRVFTEPSTTFNRQNAREIQTRPNVSVVWKANATNTVKISQRIFDSTNISGVGKGQKTVQCN